MRTGLWAAAGLFLAAGLYLLLSHTFIFRRIKAAALPMSDMQHAYLVGDPAATTSLRYAAIGDSLTAGVGVARYEDSYPFRLAQRLAAERGSVALQSFAYPGARSADVVRDLLQPAINADPQLVTVLVGTNDTHGNVSAADFAARYRTLLSQLTRETSATVYAVSIPYLGTDSLILPPWNWRYDRKTAQCNVIIRDLAASFGVRFIDLAAPTKAAGKAGGAYYAADSFHPSAAGYALWADIIYDGLDR